MSTLTVPLNKDLSERIEEMVRLGHAASKADFARKAIERLLEEEAILDVLRAEQEVRDGKVLTGDLDEIACKI